MNFGTNEKKNLNSKTHVKINVQKNGAKENI